MAINKRNLQTEIISLHKSGIGKPGDILDILNAIDSIDLLFLDLDEGILRILGQEIGEWVTVRCIGGRGEE